MEQERKDEWRAILGFEGTYEVSRKGEVRSLTRTLADGRTFKGRLLKPWRSNTGYLLVTLPGGVKKKVHRLVAEAFIPNPDHMPFVLHADGSRDNNEAENLRWGTNSDNLHDAIVHGTYRNVAAEKPECKNHHPFTPDNIYTPPGTNYRVCIRCRTERQSQKLLPNDPRHGTLAGYAAGDRCSACRKARSEYQKQWAKRKREND